MRKESSPLELCAEFDANAPAYGQRVHLDVRESLWRVRNFVSKFL